MTQSACSAAEEVDRVIDERGPQFFDVDIKAGDWHAEAGRNFVDRYASDDSELEAIPATPRRCGNALWPYLDGVDVAQVTPEVAG